MSFSNRTSPLPHTETKAILGFILFGSVSINLGKMAEKSLLVLLMTGLT